MTQPALIQPPRPAPLILAVDDDRTLRMVLISKLEELGYATLEASDGQEALDIIRAHGGEIDAVLLDREMPVMNGMELVKRLKEKPEFRKLPIIMQTGSDKPEQIRQGIDAGVFYYLTKPVDQDILHSVLTAAIRETNKQRLLSHELKKHKTSFSLMEICRFHLRVLEEAEQLATFLANCFPDAERVIGGLAELLINAVEHGNLGITYDEKSTLVKDGTWREEISRRAALPENITKSVLVTYRHKTDGYYVTIADEGRGFEWKNYLQIDPARASDNHGRGIAQANALSFDTIHYNESGNEVTAYISHDQALEW